VLDHSAGALIRVIGTERDLHDRTLAHVTPGNEQAITAAVRDYFDAGATEVIFPQTNLLGDDARLRTWRLLDELATEQRPLRRPRLAENGRLRTVSRPRS
jgi:hypothetical protein